ncbi:MULTISPECIES: membrane-associated oxidoreductase [unclassified Streptomyces]|uniref:membrane-associated oxidoreductase n=1 Tax=unclassified Streptomyces TaxID=2593676 RepID=UPI002DDAAFDE|nr:membrane-associated oxidoreductase [Streptomyces sp. NBC_01445]WSE04170.1 membrane-associated oxidoreductase [Streptomyces sp. NBC_01445]
MEINDLTPAERRVWDAFPRGEAIDFTEDHGELPEDHERPLPERTLRASVLRRLLLRADRAEGHTAQVWVAGARITGRLYLGYSTIDFPVHLGACAFDEAPNFYGAQIRQLELPRSTMPALHAATARIDGVLRISGCRIPGSVRLGGARIAGAFFLDRAELGRTTDLDEPALQLNHSMVEGDVFGPDLVAHAQVRMVGMTVAGSVDLDDARLHDGDGDALDAENLTVGSDLRAMRLQTRGRLNLRGARIPGQLNLAHADLSHPAGIALRASNATIGELWLRSAQPIRGAVNFRGARLDLLHVAPEILPDKLRLDGLTYATLTPHEPAPKRLPMLQRDQDGYVPFAYEQLTAAYRRIGDADAARTIQLAKQRRHRATLPAYARLWGHIQDVTVGYGFRPMRAAGWLLSLLAIGSVAFALHHPSPLKPDESPDFNAVFYALDLLLPIIDFGQESAFSPTGWHQALSYVLIITGWILATTVAAGITRTVSRQ